MAIVWSAGEIVTAQHFVGDVAGDGIIIGGLQGEEEFLGLFLGLPTQFVGVNRIGPMRDGVGGVYAHAGSCSIRGPWTARSA